MLMGVALTHATGYGTKQAGWLALLKAGEAGQERVTGGPCCSPAADNMQCRPGYLHSWSAQATDRAALQTCEGCAWGPLEGAEGRAGPDGRAGQPRRSLERRTRGRLHTHALAHRTQQPHTEQERALQACQVRAARRVRPMCHSSWHAGGVVAAPE